MIISRTPVRISIGGGGTDLPSYYKKFGCYFISAAIDKYIYIIVQERKWYEAFLLKYSKTEEVKKVSEIKNEIIRECLKFLHIKQPLEIVAISDVGGQTGLGSSGAFTVGLLNALHAFKNEVVSQEQLAEEACHIAIDILKQPSGKQDEYIASFGGFRSFVIKKNGKVKVQDEFDPDFVRELEHYLYMFHTGITRESKSILDIQQQATKQNDKEVLNNLHQVSSLGEKIRRVLVSESAFSFGGLLHEHWQLKRKRQGTTNEQIDQWYEMARKAGALGGKIMGAGGGGFFLFYCQQDSHKLIRSLVIGGLKHIPFHFENQGSKIIVDF